MIDKTFSILNHHKIYLCIRRDKNGVAVIPVKLFKSEKEVYTLVSDEDYYHLVKEKWYLNKGRYAWSRNNKEKVIDHANCDKLDNRRENLRLVSRSTNCRNKRKAESSPTLAGVSYHKQSNKWRSRLKLQGKEISLGYFHTAEEAHNAYKAKREELERAEGLSV